MEQYEFFEMARRLRNIDRAEWEQLITDGGEPIQRCPLDTWWEEFSNGPTTWLLKRSSAVQATFFDRISGDNSWLKCDQENLERAGRFLREMSNHASAAAAEKAARLLEKETTVG